MLLYLARVEPFTTLSVQLHGGKFAREDRMFSDIAATWKGVLQDMENVKELVSSSSLQVKSVAIYVHDTSLCFVGSRVVLPSRGVDQRESYKAWYCKPSSVG